MSQQSNDVRVRAAAGNGSGDAVDLATRQFRDFYDVLARAAQAVTRLGEDEARGAAEALSHQLCQMIELQSLEARRVGGRTGIEVEVQGSFLKAALADEVLLSTDWAGRSYWRHVLVEARLFKSSHAGERVFQDLDQLLREREPARRNLGRLYLYLLSLGFQGRYRGQPQDKIAEYRRELFQFVYQRAPDLQGRDRTLSGQAYESTLSHLKAGRLPRLNRTGLLALLGILILLGLSELLWLWVSWPVRNALEGNLS